MMKSTKLISLLHFLPLISTSTASHHHHSKKFRTRKPCKTLVFYFHDISYNGKNSHNATSANVGAPAWGNRIILAGQSHFGDVVVFDDPITLNNNLHSTPVGRAQERHLHSLVRFLLRFQFNQAQRKHKLCWADPLMNKTRDISVIGGTGDFFMARGFATLMTGAFEGEVYFRLRVDIKLYECWY